MRLGKAERLGGIRPCSLHAHGVAAGGLSSQFEHDECADIIHRLARGRKLEMRHAICAMEPESKVDAELAVAIVHGPLVEIQIRAWQSQADLPSTITRGKQLCLKFGRFKLRGIASAKCPCGHGRHRARAIH